MKIKALVCFPMNGAAYNVSINKKIRAINLFSKKSILLTDNFKQNLCMKAVNFRICLMAA